MCLYEFVFFCKKKTAYEMRISDWSLDVCSSDLHPLAAAAKAAGVPVIGDIELFARARPSLPRHRVVAITGTNGKSTTTALIYHMLRQAGVPALLGGNIGQIGRASCRERVCQYV